MVRASDGTSALLWASRLARHAVLETMAKGGCDLDAEVGTGKTALGEAAAWGLPGTIQCLVTLKASLDHETATGATPLCTAIEFGNKEAVTALIEARLAAPPPSGHPAC